MAHFAKLGTGNIVERVEVVNNDIATTEQAGIDFLKQLYNDPNAVWKQTSYNGNFRKNFAGIDWTYDESRDAFIPPKSFESWIFVEETCSYKPPVDYPETYTKNLTDEQGNPLPDKYKWNETIINWELE
jgi:hypothetical protein